MLVIIALGLLALGLYLVVFKPWKKDSEIRFEVQDTHSNNVVESALITPVVGNTYETVEQLDAVLVPVKKARKIRAPKAAVVVKKPAKGKKRTATKKN
jgi:hypothetical protein